MSIMVELRVDPTQFTLGEIVASVDDVQAEIERIVPTGNEVFPYVWAIGADLEPLEARLSAEPSIAEFAAVDIVDGSTLYRIEWVKHHDGIVKGIAHADGTILEARGNHEWVFRLRFPDNDAVSRFHDYCRDHGIDITVERVVRLGGSDRRDELGITPPQREALLLALERGYFATPKETSLDDLAAELSVSQQALSARIRRGNEAVLRGVFSSTTSGT